MFWLVEYVLVISALVITIELQLKKNRHGGGVEWSFGSTLAVALTFIPLKLVAMRVWQLTVGEESARSGSSWRSRVSRPRMDTRLASELEGLSN